MGVTVTSDRIAFLAALRRDGVAVFDCAALLEEEEGRLRNLRAAAEGGGSAATGVENAGQPNGGERAAAVTQEDVYRALAAKLPQELLGSAVMASLAPTQIKMCAVTAPVAAATADVDESAGTIVSAVTYGEQRAGGKHLAHGTTEGNKSGTTNLTLDPCHVDGAKAYGDSCPDVIFLLCETSCAQGGGANFVVDGAALVHDFAFEDKELGHLLENTPVEQTLYSVTALGKALHEGPLAQRFVPPTLTDNKNDVIGLASGDNHERMLVHCPNVFEGCEEERVRPCSATPDAVRDRRMIAAFADRMRRAQNVAQRFHLAKGCVLAVDNLRNWHGREPYFDLNRTLWRVWVWTNECKNLPSDITPGVSTKRDCEV